MKKTFRALLALLLLAAGTGSAPAFAQTAEARQLLLNVEKLRQLKSILADMKNGYQILYTGYTTVKDISEGSFTLHQAFLNGLLAVNPALRRYQRVADIIATQQSLVREFRDADRRFRQAGAFSAQELLYMGKVYSNLSDKSLQHLDELFLLLTDGSLRMDDAERLEAINRIFRETQDKLIFLRHFNRQASLLALQREKEQKNLQALQQQYGLQHID